MCVLKTNSIIVVYVSNQGPKPSTAWLPAVPNIEVHGLDFRCTPPRCCAARVLCVPSRWSLKLFEWKGEGKRQPYRYHAQPFQAQPPLSDSVQRGERYRLRMAAASGQCPNYNLKQYPHSLSMSGGSSRIVASSHSILEHPQAGRLL